jgi:hypothetical protein
MVRAMTYRAQYVGCVAGAVTRDEYSRYLTDAVVSR